MGITTQEPTRQKGQNSIHHGYNYKFWVRTKVHKNQNVQGLRSATPTEGGSGAVILSEPAEVGAGEGVGEGVGVDAMVDAGVGDFCPGL